MSRIYQLKLQQKSLESLTIFFFISSLIACFPVLTVGQHAPEGGESQPALLEKTGDPYLPVSKESLKYSPAYTYSSPGFIINQVNVSETGENIVGDAANEPSIAFDPNNPLRMAIGWRHFETVFNNFRQAGVGYTDDGGATWHFDEIINQGIFRSDPVLDADAEGNFYYNSLTVDGGDYYCDVYKSTDGGASWDDGTFAYGGDKQWFAVDKSGNGNIYHHWTSSYSICPPNNFTRSVNAGMSYEECTSIPGDPYWGTTTVDADGNLYISGSQGYNFVVVRSSEAQNGASSMTWDWATEVNLDGHVVGFGGYDCPNPSGIMGQVDIAIDSSGGPTHNNVYLLCSVERNSSNDPGDVMFARSTDNGLTWSDPVRVNDDQTFNTYQWFGTMSVAPDGRIDVIWLDTRENPGEVLSKLYYAASWDAGETWSQNIPLGETFDPHVGWPQQDKMGDYFDMFSTIDGAHLAWANTMNGEQDVYYSFISPDITRVEEMHVSANSRLEQVSPNPASHEAALSFRLDGNEMVVIELLDLRGRKVAELLHEEQAAGRHTITFDASGLTPGMYFCRMTAGASGSTLKLVVE